MYFAHLEFSVEILALFFIIAILYGSVGFGGGSSYLAILSLFGIDYLLLRSTALICNITVVGGSSLLYLQKGFFKWKKIIPTVLLSIPMAYLGGRIQIEEQVFFIILGIALIIAAILMLLQKRLYQSNTKLNFFKNHIYLNIGIGGLIGFFSGLIGIGGGIFLAPVLYLIKWDKPKVIAATAAFFILVNSVAGLAGQLSNPEFYLDYGFVIPLVITVLVGGQIGVRLGAGPLKPQLVKMLTAFLIAFVGIRILLKYSF